MVKRSGEVNEWRIDNENHSSFNWNQNKWKKEINQKTENYRLEKWQNEMKKKPTLKMYFDNKIKPQKEIYYDGSFGSSLLFKARSGSLELNSRTYRWNENQTKLCTKCNEGVEEDLSHVMIHCEKYDWARDQFILKVKEIIGRERWIEISQIESDDFGLGYILGFGNSRSGKVIEETKKYLEKIWYIRGT